MPDLKFDLKEPEETTGSDSLPSPVQMARLPSSRVPPRNAAYADVFARPQNRIRISRTFGSLILGGTRIIVDPNDRLPESLLKKSSDSFSIYDPPPTNLALSVSFGSIDADIDVRPFAPGTVHKELRNDGIFSYKSQQKAHQVFLKSSTNTGNTTLRIDALGSARIYLEAGTAFGQTRIYLPRKFNGPLTISSTVRAPHLSSELRRACTPVSEGSGTTRWFVGDIAEWTANNELGDDARVEAGFGSVWVGYLGEEEEGGHALGGQLVYWGKNILAVVLLIYAIYWIPVLLWRLLCLMFSLI